jgi:hypothetical protein
MALLGEEMGRKCCVHWANDWSVLSITGPENRHDVFGPEGAMTSSGTGVVLNDALGDLFLDATIANAFVAANAQGQRFEILDGFSGSGMTN